MITEPIMSNNHESNAPANALSKRDMIGIRPNLVLTLCRNPEVAATPTYPVKEMALEH